MGQAIKADQALDDDCGVGSGVWPQAGGEPSVAPFADEDEEWGRRLALVGIPPGEGDRRPDAGEPPLLVSNADTLGAPPPLLAAGGEHSVGASAAMVAVTVVNGATSSGSAVVNRTAQIITAAEPSVAVMVAERVVLEGGSAGTITVAERVVSEGGGALVQAESRQVSVNAVWSGAVTWSRLNLARSATGERGKVPSVVHFLVGWVTSKVLGRRVWHT